MLCCVRSCGHALVQTHAQGLVHIIHEWEGTVGLMNGQPDKKKMLYLHLIVVTLLVAARGPRIPSTLVVILCQYVNALTRLIASKLVYCKGRLYRIPPVERILHSNSFFLLPTLKKEKKLPENSWIINKQINTFFTRLLSILVQSILQKIIWFQSHIQIFSRFILGISK